MFAFVDESSFPRPNDKSEYSVLLATCIKVENIRRMTRLVYQMKINIYGGGTDNEKKARDLIVPRTMRPDRSHNKEFVDQLFGMIAGEDMSVYAIVMERPDNEIEIDENKLPYHYTYLLQRVNACGSEAHRNVSIIFDGQDPKSDEKISRKFYNLVYGSQYCDNIIEMPLFVSSKIVPGIQLADIMAGVVRHYYINKLDINAPSNPFQAWIAEKYQIIQGKTSRHRINGFNTYGIYMVHKKN
jgi:hypothetical protein